MRFQAEVAAAIPRQANVLGGLTQGQNLAKNAAGISIHQLQTHQSAAAHWSCDRPREVRVFSSFLEDFMSSLFWTIRPWKFLCFKFHNMVQPGARRMKSLMCQKHEPPQEWIVRTFTWPKLVVPGPWVLIHTLVLFKISCLVIKPMIFAYIKEGKKIHTNQLLWCLDVFSRF